MLCISDKAAQRPISSRGYGSVYMDWLPCKSEADWQTVFMYPVRIARVAPFGMRNKKLLADILQNIHKSKP